MAREDPQMKLRLPPELKAVVEDAAQRAGRSLNAEIIYRLASTFAAEAGADQASAVAAELAASAETLKQLVEALTRNIEARGKV